MKKHARPPARNRPRAPSSETSAAGVEVIYGLRAGLAAISRRPRDVIRVGCAGSLRNVVERALRDSRLATTPMILGDHQLEQAARTTQHEGLCLEMRARVWAGPNELADHLVSERGTALALDRVRNSYNIGAILRSAAFFGLDALLLGAPAPHPGLDGNAVRVAEGGAEHVLLSRTTDLADTLSRLRARGIRVVGTDGAARESALDHDFRGPTVIVLGNEREGLGPRVRAQCDEVVAIRGSGAVESLNVGVAAGILLARVAHLARDAT